MEKCKCGKEFKNLAGLKCHEKYCDGILGTKRDVRDKLWWTHCPKCGYEIKASKQKHYDYCDGSGPSRIIERKSVGHAGGWNKGLTKDENSSILKISESLVKYYQTNKHPWVGKKHTEKTKEIIRQHKLDLYASGWEATSCGRAKKISYESPIAGLVKLDGSWELLVATYLDNQKLQWKRNKNRFAYINLKGKDATYCPDFWVEDWKTYIEVKGYKTDLDQCKWDQFEHQLLIWDKKELIRLNILH